MGRVGGEHPARGGVDREHVVVCSVVGCSVDRWTQPWMSRFRQFSSTLCLHRPGPDLWSRIAYEFGVLVADGPWELERLDCRRAHVDVGAAVMVYYGLGLAP